MLDGFELAVLFTTAGALTGGGLVKIILSALKGFGLIPEHGRGILVANALVSLALIALAAFDAAFLRDGITGLEVLVVVMSWIGIYTAAIGVHETVAKASAIAGGRTNPHGADAGGGLGPG